LACLLLGNAGHEKYKEVIDELAYDRNLAYPKDVPSMVSMLNNWSGAGFTKKIDEMKDGILTTVSGKPGQPPSQQVQKVLQG
jgi:hypothetical protein